MARTLEFYYDYGSPYSYLADTQVEAIARRTEASLARKPMLLGGVFKATGNADDGGAEVEMERLRHADVGPAAAQIDGFFERYHPAIYKAMWINGVNLNDMGEVAKVLAAAGLDAARVGSRIQDQDVKDRLKATTDEAMARRRIGAQGRAQVMSSRA